MIEKDIDHRRMAKNNGQGKRTLTVAHRIGICSMSKKKTDESQRIWCFLATAGDMQRSTALFLNVILNERHRFLLAQIHACKEGRYRSVGVEHRGIGQGQILSLA